MKMMASRRSMQRGKGRNRWKYAVSVELRQTIKMPGTRPHSTSLMALLMNRH